MCVRFASFLLVLASVSLSASVAGWGFGSSFSSDEATHPMIKNTFVCWLSFQTATLLPLAAQTLRLGPWETFHETQIEEDPSGRYEGRHKHGGQMLCVLLGSPLPRTEKTKKVHANRYLHTFMGYHAFRRKGMTEPLENSGGFSRRSKARPKDRGDENPRLFGTLASHFSLCHNRQSPERLWPALEKKHGGRKRKRSDWATSSTCCCCTYRSSTGVRA